MAKRTVMRSSKGKKLYAVRDSEGQFKDIQTVRARARGGPQARHPSKAEEKKVASRKKKAKKKTAKKTTKRRAAKKAHEAAGEARGSQDDGEEHGPQGGAQGEVAGRDQRRLGPG